MCNPVNGLYVWPPRRSPTVHYGMECGKPGDRADCTRRTTARGRSGKEGARRSDAARASKAAIGGAQAGRSMSVSMCDWPSIPSARDGSAPRPRTIPSGIGEDRPRHGRREPQCAGGPSGHGGVGSAAGAGGQEEAAGPREGAELDDPPGCDRDEDGRRRVPPRVRRAVRHVHRRAGHRGRRCRDCRRAPTRHSRRFFKRSRWSWSEIGRGFRHPGSRVVSSPSMARSRSCSCQSPGPG